MAETYCGLGLSGVSWIEHYLVHGPGDVQGQPIDLDDEFAGFVLKAYALDESGARRVRRAFLSRSKGRSKSGFAAMIECYEALGPCRFDHWAEAGEVSPWGYEYEEGEAVGRPLGYVEILNVATEESQAGNTYDAVHFMLNEDTCSVELRRTYGRIDVGLTRINLPGKRGFIEPVTASNESKDGGKSTFIVADETHLWTPPATGKFKLGKMHQTMVRNLLKRKVASGWMLETSTMYAEGEQSVAEGTHAYAKQLAKAGRGDGKLLFDHRQASDSWDLSKRRERLKALKEAYGPAAAWMDLDAIADYWDDPQASHAEFRRFWLNQPVPTVEVVVQQLLPNWPACATTDQLPDQPEALGLAVSIDQQWVSIAAVGMVDDRFFLGAAVPRMAGTADLVETLVAELARMQNENGMIPVAIDKRGPAAYLIPTLEDADIVLEIVDTADYLSACSELFDSVARGDLLHGDHPDLNAAVKNATKRTVGDRWAWARKNGDISMLEAATLARWTADLVRNSVLIG